MNHRLVNRTERDVLRPAFRPARRMDRNRRRGNTLVLVTAILVLLVIIATAYITRAQGGRVIAAAQRKAIDREDRSQLAVGVVANEIASNLFPKLVDAAVRYIRAVEEPISMDDLEMRRAMLEGTPYSSWTTAKKLYRCAGVVQARSQPSRGSVLKNGVDGRRMSSASH